MNKIIVVEDDSRLNQAVCKYLNDCGYETTGVLSASEAYDEMFNTKFDLIISDIMMLDIDGFEFTQTIRETDRQTPILFMTAKDDMPSKSKGYLLGIDDYMVKPINLEELALHVGALFRRAGIMTEKVLTIGNFVMNAEEVTVTWNGEDIPVTAREFNIYCKLLSNPKKAFSRTRIMEEFWDADTETTLRAVDMYIAKLREKFSVCTEFKILTVYGVGYKAVLQ